jgi:putative redox protein
LIYRAGYNSDAFVQTRNGHRFTRLAKWPPRLWQIYAPKGERTMETTTATLPTPPTPARPQSLFHPHVIVRGSGYTFLQEISAGNHRFQADEPASVGGTDAAPDPYDYLMASLGACTSMMVGLHARKRSWPLDRIDVALTHSRIHAHDCEECVTKDGMIDRIEIAVELTGPLTNEQRSELMKTAANCPIHRALTREVNVRLRPVNGA